MRKFVKLLRDTRGVTAIEYALIASLMSVAAIGAFAALGGEVETNYNEIDSELAKTL